MCSDIVIKVEDLCKSYQIYKKPKDRLKQSIVSTLQRLIGMQPKLYFHGFQALQGVSFEIKKGQTVGIIGRNGSGKSTLLQMICGTLTPTSGTVDTRGRIAALLELGSGFNPEFTGRENVYMNATVLGLTQEEINARFNDIVAFADVGEFIDQPIKTYSSGMVVRLAFAVIAHVDTEILVIDEALAVGDAIFIQKCMRFIRSFQKHGTLLFVSHDLSAVQNLCEYAIWLERGEVVEYGSSSSIAEAYLQYTLQEIYGDEQHLEATSTWSVENEKEYTQSDPPTSTDCIMSLQGNLKQAKGWKTGAAELLKLTFEHLSPSTDVVFKGGENVRVTIDAIAYQDLLSPILGFTVKDRLGQDLFGENTLPYTAKISKSVRANQKIKAEFDFQLPMLPNGQYAVTAAIADGELYDHIQHHYLHDAYIINVSSSKIRWGLMGLPFQKVLLKVLDND